MPADAHDLLMTEGLAWSPAPFVRVDSPAPGIDAALIGPMPLAGFDGPGAPPAGGAVLMVRGDRQAIGAVRLCPIDAHRPPPWRTLHAIAFGTADDGAPHHGACQETWQNVDDPAFWRLTAASVDGPLWRWAGLGHTTNPALADAVLARLWQELRPQLHLLLGRLPSSVARVHRVLPWLPLRCGPAVGDAASRQADPAKALSWLGGAARGAPGALLHWLAEPSGAGLLQTMVCGGSVPGWLQQHLGMAPALRRHLFRHAAAMPALTPAQLSAATALLGRVEPSRWPGDDTASWTLLGRLAQRLAELPPAGAGPVPCAVDLAARAWLDDPQLAPLGLLWLNALHTAWPRRFGHRYLRPDVRGLAAHPARPPAVSTLPPVWATDGRWRLEVLPSLGAIEQAGHALRLCVRQRAMTRRYLFMGHALAALSHRGTPRALVGLRVGADGRLVAGEVAGPGNAPPRARPAALVGGLIDELAVR